MAGTEKTDIGRDSTSSRIEAQSMIEAYAAAYAATGETRWADLADQVFQWYLGLERSGRPLWDPDDRGLL